MRQILSAFVAVIALLGAVTPAHAITTVQATMQKFDIQEAVSLAMRLTQHRIEADLSTSLQSYHPMSPTLVETITDVKQLRAQIIAAQNAAQITHDEIATQLSAADATTAVGALSASVASALATTNLAQPAVFAVPNSDYRIAVFNPSSQNLAKAVSTTQTASCKVASYATSAFSAASPQFVTSAGSAGQKNTLSIAGFVLGIIPVAMQCADDHSAKPNS